jgi:hypothetical protein
VDSFNKYYKVILENVNEADMPSRIDVRRRIFYPKKLKGLLSREFIECFKAERKRLVEKSGMSVKQVNQGMAKALLFFHSRF